MSRSLVGGVALVTGAGGGIGGAVAEALAREGMRVWLCGRRRDPLEAAAARLMPPDRLAGVLVADITDQGAHGRIAGAVGPRLDVLVHAAGVFRPGSAADLEPDEIERMFAVNAVGPAALTRALLPALRAARGQVVFVNSTAILRGNAAWSVYAASKAALKTLADGLRDVVNAAGVRVLSVLPGRTASPMQAAVHEWEGRPYQPERLMQPEDIAGMIVAALRAAETAEVTDLILRPMRPG
ncbi:MAG: SDR family NAD(P)-dependent oxidoreductase [Kiritimatiellae bacterium]|nr:SDR family NAD(P)-dependent oxidoreductase [Kiritimatiellia bacterium]